MMTHTPETLKTMMASEFEDIRASGEAYRHALTSAVISCLNVPENWHVNGECRGEFGGMFPVQCRFTPPDEHYHLCLCSPGELNPEWLLVLASPTGSYIRIVKTLGAFWPEKINKVLSLADRCRCLDYSLPGTAVILVTEAAA
ncbi:conjugation system SOS inhibitor PsiB (plasmid) [Cedecea neteri]|uniref:conjugation system SOS inhibitor PsiB n=1 Tax=Cedecea neteri TaxID=158822 RepID=UPI0028936793|nr:conjugation system SOS inhibitor PsiB [Cedecea neteri]WNJ82249.1 conjugation system SOS inhibitor PsiB [Cedecea neteri]